MSVGLQRLILVLLIIGGISCLYNKDLTHTTTVILPRLHCEVYLLTFLQRREADSWSRRILAILAAGVRRMDLDRKER
jgi:hypothetical protein